MLDRLNHWLDVMSDYLAHRKGLLPIISILLILVNYILQFFPGIGWLVETDLLFHFGVILAIVGIMVAWAL